MNTKMNTKLAFAMRIAAALSVAAVGMLGAASAQAGSDNHDLAVSAKVDNSCTIGTTPLAFSSYDGKAGGANETTDKDVSSHVTVTCALAGADVTISLGQGLHDITGTAAAPVRRMVNGGRTDFMTYSIFSGSSSGPNWGSAGVALTPDGTAQDLPIYGRIDKGQSLPAGSYTDTVVATVTF